MNIPHHPSPQTSHLATRGHSRPRWAPSSASSSGATCNPPDIACNQTSARGSFSDPTPRTPASSTPVLQHLALPGPCSQAIRYFASVASHNHICISKHMCFKITYVFIYDSTLSPKPVLGPKPLLHPKPVNTSTFNCVPKTARLAPESLD